MYENIVDLNALTVPVKCIYCAKCFSNQLDLALHSVNHSSTKIYHCCFCDYEGSRPLSFKSHMVKHENLVCTICDIKLKNRKMAFKHSNSHRMESQLVKCRLCGKDLMKKDIKRHKLEVHKGSTPGAVKCSVCNKEYQSRSSLKSHYSFHHKEFGIDTSKICDICGKVYCNNEKLKEHTRSHTGDKPFSCTVCPQKFMRKQLLTKHMRKHTGEQPLKCNICGRKFAYDNGYRYHMKTHTGEKNYGCPICGKAFISKSNMKVHVKGCNVPRIT